MKQPKSMAHLAYLAARKAQRWERHVERQMVVFSQVTGLLPRPAPPAPREAQEAPSQPPPRA